MTLVAWWDYQARREAKRESSVKRVTVDLEKTRDVWNTGERELTETGARKLLKLIKGEK